MTKTIIQYTQEYLQQISNRELLSIILKIKDNHTNHWLSVFLKKLYPFVYNELRNRTIFLDKTETRRYDSLPARLYCIEHDIMEQPICQNPKCPGHNPVKWYSYTNSFRKYCCVRCGSVCEASQSLRKSTMKKRHGVEHALQSELIRERAKETWKRNLGVDHPSKSSVVRQKYEDTMVDRYGVKSPLQSHQLVQKVIETNRKKFHCDWYTQSPEYYKTAHKRYVNPKYPNMTFASSWEFKVYDFLTENHIEFEYQPEISIPYEYDGTHHTYHPDFLVNGRLFEVKGDNFFRINESTGEEEMFNPYRDSDWSDDRYEWECRKYEAKHQCMLANNIVILRYSHIENLTVQLFQT